MARPDPTFVAQLIATADAGAADPQPAAGLVGGCADSLRRQPDAGDCGIGFRTRQTI